jgi:Ca-activated chloride channel family protein
MYELDNPYYFYLLVSMPLLALGYLILWIWKRRKQREFGDPALLKRLAPEQSRNKPPLKLVFWFLILASLSIALVNPMVGTRLETVKREGIDIVFAIDVSKSMLAADVRPNRLLKARQIISRTLDKLVSDRIGIIIYAGRAYPQLPITTDYSAARMFLNNISTDLIPSQGTAIAEAIELANDFYDDEDQKNRVLVLLTDGEDHESGYVAAAEEARAKGIKVITVGIGTRRGAPVPDIRNGRNIGYKKDRNGEVVISKLSPDVLREIASLTEGLYVNGTNTRQTVEEIMGSVDELEKKEFEAQLYADYEDQFQWFLAVALLLMVLDSLVLSRKTQWFKRLGLFNERTKMEQ